ncbi:MAG: hypothetical protein MR717_06905, partial [Prevotella sp.]|nr:hypothetical protein [Prevotella sp.]
MIPSLVKALAFDMQPFGMTALPLPAVMSVLRFDFSLSVPSTGRMNISHELRRNDTSAIFVN